MKYLRLTVALALIFPAMVSAQPFDADTLVLENGGVLIGEILNYPPQDDLVIIALDDTLIYKYAMKDISGIHVSERKRNGLDLYRPSPALAFLGSTFFPGLGQLINGEITRGLIYVGIGLVAYTATFFALVIGTDKYATPNEESIAAVVAVLAFGFYLYQMIEATGTAVRMNRRGAVVTPEQPFRTGPPSVGMHKPLQSNPPLLSVKVPL